MPYDDLIDVLTWRMCAFDHGDAKRIQHFLKVHRCVQMIGRGEGLDEDALRVLECAAILHDIGIHPAEEKYGRCDGALQEKEGPEPARVLMRDLPLQEAEIERICYLIAHHHHYSMDKALDLQILMEADMLVNLFEDAAPLSAVRQSEARFFRTETGRHLCREMFAAEDE